MKPLRSVQYVLSKRDRLKISKWMIEQDASETRHVSHPSRPEVSGLLPWETQCQHNQGSPLLPCQELNYPGRIDKWCKGKGNFISFCYSVRVRVRIANAKRGRGFKRQDWVTQAHVDVFEEFNIMRNTGVKLNTSLILHMEIGIVEDPSFLPRIHTTTGFTIVSYITNRWVQ